MNCPTCKVALEQAGRTFKCDRCDGAWVEAEVLVPLLEQSASTLIALPWQPNREDHVRACPACAASMETVKLGTVALDRCEPHGVWFDAHELAALIGQAKKFRTDTQPDGTHEEHKGLLRRLAELFS
jgi:Zn-finger nucleic acid-binding protein